MASEPKTPEELHGIGSASYLLNGAVEWHQPTLICQCGHVAQGASWEDAGLAMDYHLEDEGVHVGPPTKE